MIFLLSILEKQSSNGWRKVNKNKKSVDHTCKLKKLESKDKENKKKWLTKEEKMLHK